MNVSAANGTSAFFFTLINKEHGPAAREANVTVALPDKVKHAEAIYLVSPENDAAAKTGITLGGAPIDSKGPWHGAWKPLTLESGKCIVKVAPASAAIVKITAP